MDQHNKRKLALFLQVLATVLLFVSLSSFLRDRSNYTYLIIGVLVFIVVLYYRYKVLSKHFYVQRFPKGKWMNTLSRMLPILAFIAVYYIPDNYGLNTLVGAAMFSVGTVIDEKYSKYFTHEEYEEYMKNKKKNKKK